MKFVICKLKIFVKFKRIPLNSFIKFYKMSEPIIRYLVFNFSGVLTGIYKKETFLRCLQLIN